MAAAECAVELAQCGSGGEFLDRIARDFVNDIIYPLVNIQKAIENGPVEIVDFPIKNGDFPLLC